jgi:hypothetical protein
MDLIFTPAGLSIRASAYRPDMRATQFWSKVTVLIAQINSGHQRFLPAYKLILPAIKPNRQDREIMD